MKIHGAVMRELTKAEEEVMQILWKLGKGYVKDIIDHMPEPKPAYNTVSTVVRILEKKGFVDHKSYGKTYEYFPVIEKDKYRKFYMQNFLKGYFGGSFQNMLSFFAKEQKIDIQDLEAILKESDTSNDDNNDR